MVLFHVRALLATSVVALAAAVSIPRTGASSPSPAPEAAASPGSKPAGTSISSQAPARSGQDGQASQLPDPQQCLEQARRLLGAKGGAGGGATGYAALRECMNTLLDKGGAKLALPVARAANDLFPTESQSGFDYGALLMLTGGDADQARAVIEEALQRPGRRMEISLSSRPLALNNLGKLALGRGDVTAARRYLGEALKLDGASATILYNLAAADQRAGDAAACRDHILAALERDPSGATRDDYLVAAWAYSESGLFHDSASLLGRAITKMPNESGLHLNLGYAHARGGRPFDALLEYLYEFENGSADDPYAREARRQFRDGLGQPEAGPGGADARAGPPERKPEHAGATPEPAQADSPRADANAKPPGPDPGHADTTRNRARTDRSPTGADEKQPDPDPGHADATPTQARTDLGRAEARANQAETKPDQTEAIRLLRAAMQEDSGDLARLLTDLDRLEQAGYHHVTLDLLRAEALYAAHNVTASESLLRKIMATDPAFLPPYFDLSVILRALDRDEEARRIVAQAVRRNPSHWQLVGGVPPSPP